MTNLATSAAPTVSRPRLTVEMWTDLGCPWCYLGKHRLAEAITRVDADIDVVLRSFQLHPESLAGVIETIPEIASRVHGITKERARTLEDDMTRMAAAEGLPFTIDRPTSTTFDVHRMLHLAKSHGVGTAFFADIEEEYFAGRFNPFDPDEMVTAAARHGIPENDVRRVLASTEYSDLVAADISQAKAYSVTGVPFIVYGNRFATSGAQTVEGYIQALRRALDETTAR